MASTERDYVLGTNDSEIERILEAAHDAGALEAGWVLLRLPLELKELFREWLATEFPDRASRVISILRSMHGGKDYVAAFKKANNIRPNFISLGGYDGMHLIYEALKKTQGKTDGDALVNAM